MTDKERDDALIADRLWNLADCTEDPAAQKLMLEAVHALRGDEQPKPDRYVVALREVSAEMTTQEPLKDEFIKGDRDKDEWFQAAAAVLRKHFPERPAVVVPLFTEEEIAAAHRCVKVLFAEPGSAMYIAAHAVLRVARESKIDGAKGGE